MANEEIQETIDTGDWEFGVSGASDEVATSGKDLPWRWEEGDKTVTRTIAWSAPGCHEGCGVLLYTDKDGNLIDIEGDPENPFNKGRLCARCLDFKEVLYHPDRIHHPMRRPRIKEDRGTDKWVRMTWDEAYDYVDEHLQAIKEKYGAESVIFCQGTGRDIVSGITRFAYAFGSPNTAYLQTGIACYGPRVSATSMIAGSFFVADYAQYFADRYDNPEWRCPKNVFIWGNNPIISNADGVLGHWVVDVKKMGARWITVDPRLTWMAAQSELHLQLRPGTDAALAMGMLNYIIQNDMYDHEIVESWCYGFEELAERVSPFTLEKTSELTYVPVEKIVKACEYACEKPSTLQWGLALDQTQEAISASMSVMDIFAITGQMDIPGGLITVFQPFGARVWMPAPIEEFLPKSQIDKQIGIAEFPLYKYSGVVNTQPDMTIDIMIDGDEGKPYPIKAAWIQSSNMLPNTSQSPESRVAKGLANLDFIVGVDLFMTPTLQAYADVVLPCATFAERDGLRSVYFYIQAMNKAVTLPEGEWDTKSDFTIWAELGHRWNTKAYPWDDPDPIQRTRDYFSGGPMSQAQFDFEEVRENNWIYPKYQYEKFRKGTQRPDGKLGFTTTTGRLELFSTLMHSWGFAPMPEYHEPDQSPVSTPELMDEYPLILTTGGRDWFSFHSEHRQIPRLRAMKKWPECQINPVKAAELGIREGDWVWIENTYGKVMQKAKITHEVPEWLVHCDHGWWFPEIKDPARNFDTYKCNINQLIPPKYGSTGMGANCKSLICKVYRVEDETEVPRYGC